jgi:hypothetical protein
MPFQVCTRDEYGQVSILGTKTNIDEAVKMVKDRVNEDNMENALTMDEKYKDWTSCFIEVPTLCSVGDNIEIKSVFGGREGLSKYILWNIGKEVSKGYLDTTGKVSLFIGYDKPNKKDVNPVYAKDVKGKQIDSVNHQNMENKTLYFIHYQK